MNKFLSKDMQAFKKKLNYECNINNPKTHNEKVMQKKILDRNELLSITSDKIKIKEYVDDKIPNNNFFNHRLFASYDISDLQIKEIPCVIKMNNASGRNIFITHEEQISKSISQIKEWYDIPYGIEKCEWCYENIKPGYVIEKLLNQNELKILKFMCFNGEPKYIFDTIYKIKDSGTGNKVIGISTYDINWNKIDVKYDNYSNEYKTEIPKNIKELIEISKILSKDFNFVRVDLMLYKEKEILFSELTHYPTSGKAKFTPIEFDYKLGELWKI